MAAGARAAARYWLLAALAVGAAGLICGATYALTTPPLAPYAPLDLSGWWFGAGTFACGALLGAALGRERPRLALAASLVVAALGATVFGLALALPAFVDDTLNTFGLVNYALTQGTFAFFVILTIAFPAAAIGLFADHLWRDR